MTRPRSQMRVLAIAPISKGFGYAVFDGEATLASWGIKHITGAKNRESLAKAKALIAHYRPDLIVLEHASAPRSRRAPRIRELIGMIGAQAARERVKVKRYSSAQVRRAFFPDGKITKEGMAATLAQRFPQSLGLKLPPKRRPWMSQDVRLGIFEAVALALMPWRPREDREMT